MFKNKPDFFIQVSQGVYNRITSHYTYRRLP